MKKFLIGLIIVIVIAGVVFLGYYWRSRQAGTATAPVENAAGSLPAAQPSNIPPVSQQTGGAGGQILGLISQTPAVDYFVDNQNNVFIVQLDGQVVEISNGQTNTLSSNTIGDLIKASFSFDGKKILFTSGSQGAQKSSVFNITSSTWQQLTSDIQNPIWSPDSYKIAYLAAAKTDANNLSVLDLGSKLPKPQTLLSIHQEDLSAQWVYPEEIFLKDKASAFYKGSLWSFNIKKKTFTPVIQEQLGLETVWDNFSDIKQGLAFVAGNNNQGGELDLINEQGQIIHKLNFLALPSKCTFGKENISSGGSSSTYQEFLYCGVPRDPNKLNVSHLPDGYEQKSLFTADDFIKVDLASGQIQPVFTDPAQMLDASDLKIFGGKLFFINRLDQKIYALPLK